MLPPRDGGGGDGGGNGGDGAGHVVIPRSCHCCLADLFAAYQRPQPSLQIWAFAKEAAIRKRTKVPKSQLKYH